MIKTSKTLKKIITNLAAHKFYIISILLFDSLQNETTRKTFYYKAPIDSQTIPPNFFSSLPQRIEHTKKTAHTKRGNFLIMKTDVEQEIIFFSLSLSRSTQQKSFHCQGNFSFQFFPFSRLGNILLGFLLCEEVNADVVKRLAVMIFECATIFSL